MKRTVLEAAIRYARDFHWPICPCNPKNKRPYTRSPSKEPGKFVRWNATTDLEQIRRWWRQWPNAMIGVDCGRAGIVVIDVDIDKEKGIDGTIAWRAMLNGNVLPDTASQKTPRGGKQFFFLAPDQVGIRDSAGDLGRGIDVRAEGGYAVVPPSVRPIGRYEWEQEPTEGIAPLPDWLFERLVSIEAKRTSQNKEARAGNPGISLPNERVVARYLATALADEADKVRHAPVGTRNNVLNSAAFDSGRLSHLGLSLAEVERTLLPAARAADPDEKESTLLATIRSGFAAGQKEPYTPEWKTVADERAKKRQPIAIGNAMVAKGTVLTEKASAERLKARYGADLRHVNAFGYLVWDSRRWCMNAKAAERRAHELGEIVRAELKDSTVIDPRVAEAYYNHAKHLETARGVEAVLKLARAFEGIDAEGTEWDADPWLLNCSNGTIDLRDGTLRPHRREDYITRICPVEYRTDATAPRWLQFLDEIFLGDRALADYFQWLIGYALTGCTAYDLFVIEHGDGDNGKTTANRIIQDLLGEDYAQQLNPEEILQQHNARHAAPIARLRGARFVVVAETGEGRRLNEALIKSMTGGDKLTGNFMRMDTFEFDPTFKLFLCTNSRPVIRDPSIGLWRRVRLLPFNAAFHKGDPRRDPHLVEKLRAEQTGILAWAVCGAGRIQAGEPELPEAVRVATDNYKVEQDVLSAFIDEECEIAAHLTVPQGELYRAYQSFTSLRCETKVAFGHRLGKIGFEKERGTHGVWQWRGIGLRHKELESAGDKR